MGHTFTIPTLGISVPLIGVNGNATNLVRSGSVHHQLRPHNIIKFSFVTPGPGSYRWQCFVPCGGG